MGLRLTTAPQQLPLDLQEVKEHLAIINDDRDSYLNNLIKAAAEVAQNYTQRAFITQTWLWTLDGFPSKLRVPRPRLQTVNYIKYIDDATGTLTTLDSSTYRVSTYHEPAIIEPVLSESWPTARSVVDAVQIEFVAGYGVDHTTVPRNLKMAMELIVAEWMERPEGQVIGASSSPIAWPAQQLMDGERLGGAFVGVGLDQC
jgi:uncharacterized phiE125 gp8 family phage protein